MDSNQGLDVVHVLYGNYKAWQHDVLSLQLTFDPYCHACWSFLVRCEFSIMLMKSEENCWIKFAPLFCSSHFSFSTSFIITASTENRPTAVTHHSSPAAQVLTAFLLLFSFLPRKTKEIGFLFFGLLRGMVFSAVLMGYCNTINPLGNRPENCLTLFVLQQSMCEDRVV